MKRLPPSLRSRVRPSFEILENRVVPALFPATTLLETLATPKGSAFNGFQADSSTGKVVRGLGDINGDSFGDFSISTDPAPGAAGEIYVVFGQASKFATDFALNTLNGANGFTIFGDGGDSIEAIDGAGDFNNDGRQDFIVGARGNDKAYVVFGKASWAATLNLGTFGASDGVILNGEDFIGQFGASVAGVGDFNGDLIADVLVGDPTAPVGTNSFSGKAFVIFGSTPGAAINMSGLPLANGFELDGIAADDHAGDAVDGGDVNGDGLADLIIGGPGFSLHDNNEAYVVFGTAVNPGPVVSLASLNGSNGFTITGAGHSDFANFGRLASDGDVNRDGFDDVLIGAGNLHGGFAFVIFGHAGAFTPLIDANALGAAGVSIAGADHGSFAEAVSFADLNNDGFSDVLIGSPVHSDIFIGDDSFQGYTYLIFGKANFAGAAVDALNGTTGMIFKGYNDFGHAGASVAAAGDINGDGSQDILIGMPDESPSTNVPGQAFVIYGRGGPPASNLTAALPNIFTSGAKSYKFTVQFSDTLGLKTKTIGNNDILVTSVGGFSQIAKFVRVNNPTNGKVRLATYKITPPAGFWDFRDNDTYTINLIDGAVKNKFNQPVGAKVLGTFTVGIPKQIIAVGKNSQAPGNIQVFAENGSLLYTIVSPFGALTGGVRVAVGDVNGDGTPDVVAASGPDAALDTEIRIFNGLDGSLIGGPLQPFGAGYKGGAYVAVGDFHANAGVEIIVGPGAQANDNSVRVLSQGGTVLQQFTPYSDTAYQGGVRVAVGDIHASAGLELVTAMDSITEVSKIRAWDNAFTATPLWEQTPNTGAGGASLAIGNVDAAPDNEVIVGPEGFNSPIVRILDGDTGSEATNFLAYSSTRPVRVGVLDVNLDGVEDFLVAAGKGRKVTVFDGTTKAKIDSIGAFELLFKGGLFVAGG